MTDTSLDCGHVRDTDAIDRYLRGRMPEPEARAFEEHYFTCEECWAELQIALEAGAAFASVTEGAGSGTSGPDRRARVRAWGALAAAAAAAAFVIFGIWRPGGDGGPPEGAFRGGESTVSVETAASGSFLRADWESHPEAELYRVRLYSEEGRLLFEREVREPGIEVPVSALPPAAGEIGLYWRVDALNGLRQVIASSSLTRARGPGD